MAKKPMQITIPESPEAWVLHRLIGHHPTSPNLYLLGITARTHDLRERIEEVIQEDTFQSRIEDLGFQHIIEKRLADDAEQLVLTSITPDPALCPYCQKPYEPPVVSKFERLARLVLNRLERKVGAFEVMPKWEPADQAAYDALTAFNIIILDDIRKIRAEED